jgi:predicted metal-dependent phosphoesterase TrpH
VEKEVMSPKSVIGLIRQIGGVAVLAHPGISRVDDDLPDLVACGLEGIEAFHADHSLEQVHEYLGIAKRHDMFVTGGSDFHGEAVRGLGVGAVYVPDCVLDGLEARRRPRS